MTRHPDWPTLLAAHLTSVTLLPFAWVHNDCCTFAAGAVQAITGNDAMAALRGKYTCQAGAARLIATAGSLQALVSQYLGAPLDAPALAQRGDVVLFEMTDPCGPQALGICVGAQIAAPGPHGMVLLPSNAAVAAWRI
jgi:hypothetical protein